MGKHLLDFAIATAIGGAVAAVALAVHFWVIHGHVRLDGDLSVVVWLPAATLIAASGFFLFYARLARKRRRVWLSSVLLLVAAACFFPGAFVFGAMDKDAYPNLAGEAAREAWFQSRLSPIDSSARALALKNKAIQGDVGRVLHVAPGPRRGQSVVGGMNDTALDLDLDIEGEKGRGTLIVRGPMRDDGELPAVEWRSGGASTPLTKPTR